MQDREVVKKRPGYPKLLLVWLKYFSFSEAGTSLQVANIKCYLKYWLKAIKMLTRLEDQT